jgi:hypothetical protein
MARRQRKMTETAMGLMTGKRGLIMGLANDKSIAWGIAKAVADEGAELAFSYQGEQLAQTGEAAGRTGRLLHRAALRRGRCRKSRRAVRALEANGAASISSSTPSAFPTRTSCAAATSTPAPRISP